MVVGLLIGAGVGIFLGVLVTCLIVAGGSKEYYFESQEEEDDERIKEM